MSIAVRFRCVLGFALSLSLIPLLVGCARLPPEKNALSGIRLKVQMRFRSTIVPNYEYFFLLNNTQTAAHPEGDQNAPGPIPVVLPPYGNGVATSSSPSRETIGFTDLVRFNADGYRLYQVVKDASGNFQLRPTSQRPVNALLPGSGTIDDKTLQFEIDLSQIVRQADGSNFSNPADAVAAARNLRYLQMNLIATNRVPTDPVTPINKQTDSLGETASPGGSFNPGLGISSFLTLDLQRARYSSQDSDLLNTQEPTDPDVFGGNDPALDLLSWTIEIRRQ